MAFSGGTHRLVVVLQHEQCRQLPDLGHVDGFEQLALVSCSISECADGDPVVLAAQFVREGDACGDRDLRTHDSIAALETLLGVLEVHGAADAVVLAVALAHALA